VDGRHAPGGLRHVAHRVLAGVMTVSCVTALLVGASGSVAQAGAVTYVTYNCYHVRTAPRSIMFACADAGFYVKRLDWARWGVRTASADGVFHQNDCDPNCAAGTFRSRRGTITLSGRLWCPSIKEHVFKRVRAVYRHPLNGQAGYSGQLFCPLGASAR